MEFAQRFAKGWMILSNVSIQTSCSYRRRAHCLSNCPKVGNHQCHIHCYTPLRRRDIQESQLGQRNRLLRSAVEPEPRLILMIWKVECSILITTEYTASIAIFPVAQVRLSVSCGKNNGWKICWNGPVLLPNSMSLYSCAVT